MDPCGLASYHNHSLFNQSLEAEGQPIDTHQVSRYESKSWRIPSSETMEASRSACSAGGYTAFVCHGTRLDVLDMVDASYQLASIRYGQKELKE